MATLKKHTWVFQLAFSLTKMTAQMDGPAERNVFSTHVHLTLPSTFEELLNGNFGDMCSFFLSLDPANINKEITSLLGSAHIFMEMKSIKASLMRYMKKWLYNVWQNKKVNYGKTGTNVHCIEVLQCPPKDAWKESLQIGICPDHDDAFTLDYHTH